MCIVLLYRYSIVVCIVGTLVDHVAELRKALVAQHQQMFSPPVPDVEVYTSEELATSSHPQDHCQGEINHGMSRSNVNFIHGCTLYSHAWST